MTVGLATLLLTLLPRAVPPSPSFVEIELTGGKVNPDVAALSCNGGLIKLWDTTNFALAYRPVGHLDVVRTLAFTPDGKHLLTAGHDTNIKVWQLPE